MKKILTACANEKKHQKKISKNPVFFKIAKIEKSKRVDPTISRFLDIFFGILWAERSKNELQKIYQKILYFSKWPKSQKSDRVDPTISRFLDPLFAILWAKRSKNELFFRKSSFIGIKRKKIINFHFFL